MELQRLKTSVGLRFRVPNSLREQGELYFQIIHNREVRTVGTGHTVYADEWSRRSNDLRLQGTPSRVDALQKIQESIRADQLLFEDVVATLESLQGAFTAADVVELFNERKRYGEIGAFVTALIEEQHARLHSRTAEIYATALRSFKRFCGNAPVMLEALNERVVATYLLHLENRRLSRNTISFYMRVLHAIYAKAVERHLTRDRHPFRHARRSVEKTVKRAIDTDFIRRMKALDLPAGSIADRARDLFLFSFYTRGMSFVDMAYLRKTDLHGDHLLYHRRKTGQRLIVRYEPCMHAIVTKYDTTDTPYLLPIILYPDDERRQYQTMQREVNRALKDVAQMVGLRSPLTMYVARHTWASAAKSNNIPISVISEGMGHGSEKTTRIYLASLDNAVIDHANALILKNI